ncbi:multidrug DMT transporter permease [Plastoroseomonas arctica]|uniref:Multidrug DMT transporter permease n=1 Tax=Plastoroseomonas arctica TaxID=1509237 RepID=A0AAF1JVV5_9PROT|nr:multidrug DMT transporter permease [Plastoroseomonas arctica]MBR0654826.1 multidrug DMT transporter permease [Plastoroseomonas arctica]
MSPYFFAVLLLSGAAFIQSKSSAPELRPESPLANTAWRLLGKACFVAWLALIIWGALRLHWSQPLAAVVGSLAFNAFLARLGPRPFWPGLSMLCGVAGLALAGFTVFFR